jgi:hypothetical protein
MIRQPPAQMATVNMPEVCILVFGVCALIVGAVQNIVGIFRINSQNELKSTFFNRTSTKCR